MLFNIWVTDACNMECAYCYEGKNKTKTYMSRETADGVFDFICAREHIRQDDYFVVNYHGGEPFLNYDIITYLTEKIKKEFPEKALFGATTNALLLDEEKCEFMVENFTYNLSVSIDGCKATHDMNRRTKGGIGTYDVVVKNIKALLGKRSDVRGRMTYTPDTVGDLCDNVSHLVDLGFKIIVPVPDYSDGRWTEEHGQILEKELLKLYEKYGDDKSLNIGCLNQDFRIKKGRCNAGEGEMNIDSDGTIYPCAQMVHDPDYKAGTIYDPRTDRIVKLVEEGEKEKSFCDDCGLSHWCIGSRCKLINRSLTGSFSEPAEFVCVETNAIYNAQRKAKQRTGEGR